MYKTPANRRPLYKASCARTGEVNGRWEKHASSHPPKHETSVGPLKGATRRYAATQIDLVPAQQPGRCAWNATHMFHVKRHSRLLLHRPNARSSGYL